MGAVFCIVGKSNAGKTTLLERLIPRLADKGLSVAAIKHHAHGDVEFDQPGKDSYRLRQAGARAVVFSSPREVVSMKRVSGDTPLPVLVAALALEHAIVLAEGYKETPGFPKIEVHRQVLGPDLITLPEERLAVVSDGAPQVECPLFAPDDLDGLVLFLTEHAQELEKKEEIEIALLMNGQAVFLNPFARSILARGLWGMLSALKGGESATAAEVLVRRILR